MHKFTLADFQALIGRDAGEVSPSPLGRWLNGRLQAVTETDMQVAFVVRADMLNPAGLAHGGALAAMLDECMGMLLSLHGGKHFFATINLTVDYLASAKPGDTLTATARVVRAGGRLAHAEAALHNAQGTLVAKAASNLVAILPGPAP